MQLRYAIAVGFVALATACAGSPYEGSEPARGDRARAARTAQSMIGTPYRYGGSTPIGFDCSGLVVFSYGSAGVRGLPHNASMLEERARPILLRELEPGDLIFFRLNGPKASHVGIYVGDRQFVHAPSRGKTVESVSFDHVYWGPRVQRAGRIQ